MTAIVSRFSSKSSLPVLPQEVSLSEKTLS
jgi:hypothetical protein